MKLAMFNLTGKVALVTGGYSGLGYACSAALAEAGADIIICARHLERCQEAGSKLEKLGIKTLSVRCDVTNAHDVDNLIAAVVKEFGKIDILVNCAGTFSEGKRVVDTDEADWERTMAVDLKGSFLCCRAATREMIKRNEGKIINVASASSFKAIAGMSVYAAAKAGLVMLTKTLALEVARYNIQVNTLSPGYFLTPFNRDFFTSEPGKNLIKSWPMRRPGNPEELKGIVIYLASPASNYMTGSEILIDGGQTI